MIIGVPKEIKIGETRVSLTPVDCRHLVDRGATVVVGCTAGVGAGFLDVEYQKAGALLEPDAEKLWARADLILKVKEPLPAEYPLLREDQALFTYLHLAANPALAQMLLTKRILGIAYESVKKGDGSFPLLKPMSEIAGILAIQVGAYFLQSPQGGAGVLLGGIAGAQPGHVVVVGAGNAGIRSIDTAVGLGARVTVLDLDVAKLRLLDERYGNRLTTLASTSANLESSIADADLVVGAVLIPGARAPTVATRKMIARMRPGGVVVDIAIDQGGCVEGIRPTSHAQPIYIDQSIIHYAVPNMPALVGRTSTLALTAVTRPFVEAIAEKGLERALLEDRALANGVNTSVGRIVCEAVAKALAKSGGF
jgi:alanine dehydrogenase